MMRLRNAVVAFGLITRFTFISSFELSSTLNTNNNFRSLPTNTTHSRAFTNSHVARKESKAWEAVTVVT